MHLDCRIMLGHSDRRSLRDHNALNHRLRSACTCTQDLFANWLPQNWPWASV